MRLIERAEQVSSLEEKEYHLDRLKDSLRLRVSNFDKIDSLFEHLKDKRRSHFEEVRKASVGVNFANLLQRWDGSLTSKEVAREDEEYEADCRFVDNQIEQQLTALDIKSEEDFCDFGNYLEAQNHLSATDSKLHKRMVEIEAKLMVRLREQDKGVSNARLALEECNQRMLDYLDEEDCLIHRHQEIMADRSSAIKLFKQRYHREHEELEAMKRKSSELQELIDRLNQEQTELQEKIDIAEARKYLVNFWNTNHIIIKELNHLQEEIERKQQQKSLIDSQIIKCNFPNSNSFADKIKMQSVRSFHQQSQSRPGSTRQMQSSSNQESQAESPKFQNTSQNTTDNFMMFSNYNSVFSHKVNHKQSSVESNKSFRIPQDNLRYFKQKKEHLQQTQNPDKSSLLNTDRTRKGKPCNSSTEKPAPEKLFESALKSTSQLHTPKLMKSASSMKKSATHSALTPASLSKAARPQHLRDNSYFTKAIAAHHERQSAIRVKDHPADGAPATATDRTVKHPSPFQRATKGQNSVQIGKSLKEKLQRELEAVKTKIRAASPVPDTQNSSKTRTQPAADGKKMSKLGFLKELFAPTHRSPAAPPLHLREESSVQLLCRVDELSKARLGAFNPFEAKSKPPRVYGFREAVLKETNEIFTVLVDWPDRGFAREGKAAGAGPLLPQADQASAGASVHARVPEAAQAR